MNLNIDGKYYKIATWFAEKEHMWPGSCTTIRETDKALLIQYNTGDERWIPKSVLIECAEPETTLNSFVDKQ